jgi:hypothetical protein
MVVRLGLGRAINSSPPEKVEKWKNEYVTEYVVEHVPQHCFSIFTFQSLELLLLPF